MKNDKKLEKLRHSAAHVLAQAVVNLYEDVKLGIGPAIDNGFYYDFVFPKDVKLSKDDLGKIEKEMKRIIKENQKFKQSEMKAKEALKFLKENDQPYSAQIAEALLKDGEKKLSFYQNGPFINLCSGPHVKSTKEIKAIKLLKVAGAYWKGDENNIMMTRIYGTAFNSKEKLKKHLENIKNAKKRDHRKLGRKLDIFCFSDLVGPGFPLFTPKGTAIIEQLRKHIEKVNRKYGFEKVMTPHVAKIDLFKLSGHADKFPEEILHVSSKRYKHLAMKPVQCPHQTQIYASKLRSYRDLPIRYMESNKQYRGEKPGELSGLSRVIAITVEDGHSFCKVDQVKEEVKIMVKIIKEFFSALGLWGQHWVSLSVRDPKKPEDYIGQPADWDKCENMLEEVAEEMNLGAKRCEGEAAVYGPKLDFMFEDALGREIQIPTVQLDFSTPKKFDLYYIDENGDKVPPVMVHRAILGSYERLLVLLIEHFGGAFPVWFAPVQAIVLPVSEKQTNYAESVLKKMKKSDLRVEIDNRPEPLSSRIRDAQEQKIPYMIIVGDKEVEAGNVSIRDRKGKQKNNVELKGFIKDLLEEIHKKVIE